MAARTGAHQDQAVDAGLQRALGVRHVGHVVEHQAAVAVRRDDHVVRGAQRGDLDRHLVLLAHVDVVLQAVVGAVHDLVHREGRDLLLRMLRLVVGQLAGDALQPLLEHLLRARVQRREGADDSRLALLDDEVRIGHDEQRRADHRDREVVAQQGGKGHRFAPWIRTSSCRVTGLARRRPRSQAVVAISRSRRRRPFPGPACRRGGNGCGREIP